MKRLTPRTWTLIFTGIALLALTLLAISVSNLQLSPGEPVPFRQLAPDVAPNAGTNGWGNWLLVAFRILMIAFWIILPLYIILAIVDKEMRKRLLRDIAIILPVLMLLFLLSDKQLTQRPGPSINPELFNAGTLEAGPEGTPVPGPQFVPPPSWVTTLTTAVIAVAITLIIIAVVYGIWRRSKERERLKEPLKQVEREAQAAIDAIGAGSDLRDVILRCYLQMIEALKQYRGIHRSNDMTPHEFELMLQQRGMPGEAVHQLTQLFEQVRYGTAKPGRQDEHTALASLSAIVSACQKTRAA